MSQVFQFKNESFTCAVCGAEVEKAPSGCRNHCPFCFHSLHVDFHPGDRKNACQGILEPMAIEKDSKRDWMIVFQCQKCKQLNRTRVADDDNIQKLLDLLEQKNRHSH